MVESKDWKVLKTRPRKLGFGPGPMKLSIYDELGQGREQQGKDDRE